MKTKDTVQPETLADKIRTVENLLEAGWTIKAEARIAAEAMLEETRRHAEAVRSIEERFQRESWALVETQWTLEEIAEAFHL